MRRDDRRWLGEFRRAVGPERRPNPLLVPWRWRRELLAAFLLVWGLPALSDAAGPVVAGCVVLAAVLALGAWAPGRRWVRGVITEHRLRAGMVEAGILSWRTGRLPAVLRMSARPRGIRFVLWCPAGLDVLAFVEAAGQLAAATWAHAVESDRHPRYAQLVVLRVVTAPGRPR